MVPNYVCIKYLVYTMSRIIVQIGTNKGNTNNDPVWAMCMESAPESFDWDIILVEPNPKAASIIENNYSSAGFKNFGVINLGISDKEEDLILYVDNDIPGNEVSQHASLYKSHMYKMGHTDSCLTEYKIKCVPLSYVLVDDVDYLQVDTEGHDDKILMGCDFNYFNVKKIEYEHAHLGEQRNKDLLNYLVSFGYRVIKQTLEDTIVEK